MLLSVPATLFRDSDFRLILFLPKETSRLVRMISLAPIVNGIHWYMLVLGGSAIALGAYVLMRRKPKSPEDIERERRQWLGEIGRITDGTVIDVQELASNGSRSMTLLIYKYDVAGVSYEASQDVTYLRQWINLQSCRLGLPTSVRYDPHNPGNSMVISEKWTGLRQ